MDIPQLVEGLVRKYGSVNAAARKCRMPEGTLHRLRERVNDPRLSTLRHVARGYGKPTHEIVRWLDDGGSTRK